MQGVRAGPDDVVPDRSAELRGGSRRWRTSADRCVVPGDEARERPPRRLPWARRPADKASDTTWRQPITNGLARRSNCSRRGLGPFVDREIQRAVKAQRVDAATLRRFVDDRLIGDRPANVVSGSRVRPFAVRIASGRSSAGSTCPARRRPDPGACPLYPSGSAVKVGDVVAGYPRRFQPVIDEQGNEIARTGENPGLVVAFGIRHATALIDRNPIGFVLPGA